MKTLLALGLVFLLFVTALTFSGCDDNDDDDCDCDDDDAAHDDDNDSNVDDDDDDSTPDPQHEITEPTVLLNPDGTLHARGWARSPLIQYNPARIPESLKWRTKVWDHYTIVSPDFVFTFTIADIQYFTFVGFELIDFQTGVLTSGLDLVFGRRGTFGLSPFDFTSFENGDNFMTLEYDQGQRTFTGHIAPSLLTVDLDCLITVTQNPEDDDVAVAAPFTPDGYYFYENKIIGMPASGQVTVNGATYEFDPADSFAVLDWGRGVWPHTHEWHWGFAAAYHEDGVIGFNIGDGWSQDSMGTANVQKVNGVIHKLYYLDFDYDQNALMNPWHVTSDDGRFDITLRPFYHQKAGMMIFDIGMLLDKMYGTFSGKMTLDDGTIVQFADMLGFIEHSYQKW